MKLGLVVGMPDLAKPLVAILAGADLEGNLRRAAEWGYEGVELAICKPALLDPVQTQHLLRRYGLELIGICTGEVWGGDGLGIVGMPAEVCLAAETRLREIMDFAARLGEGVMLNIGRVRGKLDESDPAGSWAKAVEAFQSLADYGAAREIRLALEPVNHYEVNWIFTTQDGIAFAKDVDRPNFGLMLDTYHMNIEDQDIHASFREARPYLFHIHISDNNRKWPGNAHIDFGAIVATLREIGYQGYLSAEVWPWPDAETAGRETVRYMRRWIPSD